MLTAAIIGFGAIAGRRQEMALPMTHADSYAALADRVQVVAVSDPDEAAQSIAERWFPACRFHASPQQMLQEEDIDILSLCAPAGTAADFLALPEVAQVRGVWCEKPVATSVAQVARLAALDQPPPSVQVNIWRRFVPEIVTIADAIRGGRFGAVHHATAYYAGSFVDNGPHAIDLARQCLGPLEVTCVEVDYDTTAPLVAAAAESGARCGFVPIPRAPYNIFELDVMCAGGRIRFAENGRRIEVQIPQRDADFPHLQILQPERETTRCDWRGGFLAALANLLDHVEDSTTILVSPLGDALDVARFALSCGTSAARAVV